MSNPAQSLSLVFLAAASPPVDQPGFAALAERAAVAFLVGLLVGAEREHSATEKEELFAGIRTFPLIGILGFVAALLSEGRSPFAFAAAAVGFGLLVVASYVLTSLGGDKGATTEIAALLVYSLGAMCFWGMEAFASALAVTATLLLSVRETLHGFAAKIVREDIYAALKLAIVTLIVLPLLPDAPYGPFGAWNPHRIWMYVVLIAAISFAGYVAVKAFGARKGIPMTGLLGGLASSTAVALAFSKRSHDEPRLTRPLAAAIVIASTIMFVRVLVTATIVCPPLLDRLWKPVALLTLAGAVASLVLHHDRNAGKETEEVALHNPFELGAALKFGAFLAVIFLVAKLAYNQFQERGLYAASLLAGLTDVDAITLQAANQAQDQGAAFFGTATTVIVLAMMANTVVKGTMTVTLGSRELRRCTVPAYAAIVAVGLLSAFLFG